MAIYRVALMMQSGKIVVYNVSRSTADQLLKEREMEPSMKKNEEAQ